MDKNNEENIVKSKNETVILKEKKEDKSISGSTDLTEQNIIIQDIQKNFINDEKNELFRCNKCYSFPILYDDGNNPNRTVKIKYSCDHFHESDILELEKIRNTKPQCYHCKKVLSIIHHNYLFL